MAPAFLLSFFLPFPLLSLSLSQRRKKERGKEGKRERGNGGNGGKAGTPWP
jgi:hypothetical protein